MEKPKLLIFASGTKEGGGSGFENLVTSPDLDAEIVAVVSPHEYGGVQARADRLGIPFIHFSPQEHPNKLKNVGISYREIVQRTNAEWVALSGWTRQVHGLDPRRTFNIHPALLSFDHGPFDGFDPFDRLSASKLTAGGLRASRFGGKGMYGHHIHEAVKKALDAGEITESGFSMHFVTEEMDRGPIFFEYRVPIHKGMSSNDIARAVNKEEHAWQPKITNLVVHEHIRWDGTNPSSLVCQEQM